MFNQKIKNQIWNIGLLTAGVFLLGSETLAEEKPIELEPYAVVATKTAIDLDRLSPSVEYIGAKEIIKWQDKNLVDVLAQQTGLTLISAGTTGAQTSLFSRGTESNHTAFFLDGRRLNSGFGNQYDLESLPINNLGSVQLQRGASSVLYGSSNIGGVVDLRSRDARQGTGGSLSIEAGSNSYLRGSISAQIDEENLGISLGLNHLKTDNERPNDAYETRSFLSRIDFQITPDLILEWVGHYVDADKELPGATVFSVFFPPDPNRIQESTNYLLSPGLRYIKDELDIHLFYSRSASKLNDTNFNIKDRLKVISDEVNLQIDYKEIEGVTLSGGFLYRSDKASDSDIGFGGAVVPYEETFNQFGVFAQAIWLPSDIFEIRAGIRYDDYSDFGTATTGSLESLLKFKSIGLSLFAKIATAYAPPSAVDIAFDGDKINTPLEPEESVAVEVGFRQELINEKLMLSALYFRNEIDELLDFVLIDPINFTFDTVNRKEALTEGVEIEIDFKPSAQFAFNLGYTYLTAEDLDQRSRLARRPRHTINFRSEFLPNESLSLGFELLAYIDREDIDPLTFAPIDHSDQVVGRVLFNWKINTDWTVFGRVENVFDRDYEPTVAFPGLGRSAYVGARLNF